MARMKLELPDEFPFVSEIPVRITDINYGGHVGNDAILAIVHEARVRFLEHHGFTESDIAGVGLIMTDVVIIFKSEGFYGDIMRVHVAVRDISRTGCDFVFKLVNAKTGKDIAHAKTGIVFFDYTERKLQATPVAFRQLFAPHE